MGWEFPYVSTYETDFPWDFGLALTEEQAQQIPEVKEMLDDPPEWLQYWAEQVGAELKDGLREAPSYIAFARDNGTVYHTYTVSAPDPFVAPHFSMLLDRTPKPQPDDPTRLAQGRVPGLKTPPPLTRIARGRRIDHRRTGRKAWPGRSRASTSRTAPATCRVRARCRWISAPTATAATRSSSSRSSPARSTASTSAG